jgi:hypothetical protein
MANPNRTDLATSEGMTVGQCEVTAPELHVTQATPPELETINKQVDSLVTQIRANAKALQPLVYAAWKIHQGRVGRPKEGAPTFSGWFDERKIPRRTGYDILDRERFERGEISKPKAIESAGGKLCGSAQLPDDPDRPNGSSEGEELWLTSIPHRPRTNGSNQDEYVLEPATVTIDSVEKAMPTASTSDVPTTWADPWGNTFEVPHRMVNQERPAPVGAVVKTELRLKREALYLELKRKINQNSSALVVRFKDLDNELDRCAVDQLEELHDIADKLIKKEAAWVKRDLAARGI